MILGNAPSHKLFELIEVKPTHDPSAPARAFSDYEVVVHRDKLPPKWSSIEKLDLAADPKARGVAGAEPRGGGSGGRKPGPPRRDSRWMPMYSDEDLLPPLALSSISFSAERQCALIHVEQVWAENLYTIEGEILHARAHSGSGEAAGKADRVRNAHSVAGAWAVRENRRG